MTSGCRVGIRYILPLAAAIAASSIQAQERIPVVGRVIRIQGADSVPVPGVRLVLHRVGQNLEGPIDTTVSDGAGRFRFRFVPDTSLLYLVSADYAGIAYISPPVNTNPSLPDTALVVTVSDTSSSEPVVLAARYLVIRRAGADGSRGVFDLLVLENRGSLTRVSSDTLHPSWVGRLPREASGVRVGEADLPSDAVIVRNDSLLVYAPVAPGEKQITLEYAVGPGRALELPFPEDSVATNVLTQDTDARVEGGEMVEVDSQSIEDLMFHRWVGAPHAGDVVRVTFGGRTAGETPAWILPVLVGLAGAGLLVAFVRLRPKRQGATLETLTDRIAELEAKFAGREGEVTPEEWQTYQADRARLRAELSGHLAARRPAT